LDPCHFLLSAPKLGTYYWLGSGLAVRP
jgi:hypothetical protein